MSAHIPAPLLWEITRGHSAYTVKRRSGGGAEFSRDPLNLTNKHSRIHEGYINDKAIGIVPNEKGGFTLYTKTSSKSHQPAKSTHKTVFGPSTSSRKSYRSILNSTGNRGYRPDLSKAAVKRASAIKASQRPVKPDPPTKLRGAKARKAAAASA
ncbi:uncharacterized protein PV09_00097 [Verruconis gallopava]|uniref:Ribosomal eL28/Mak16 domain-containing protein n=1 Tax=Verruconis gallopava TaxID=253628 RepID=A0A0D1Z869_9PEZI|nr:uncharacterized protein PV09_00097 [Verruconis gallopava]KIW09162.1 hypothetical protein PV09_00097 [Verruconis gallopava]